MSYTHVALHQTRLKGKPTFLMSPPGPDLIKAKFQNSSLSHLSRCVAYVANPRRPSVSWCQCKITARRTHSLGMPGQTGTNDTAWDVLHTCCIQEHSSVETDPKQSSRILNHVTFKCRYGRGTNPMIVSVCLRQWR